MATEILKKDLYEILGVPESATDKELVKGYRKRALKCHPDKNPDNPKATDLFRELSRALEILSDPAARAAYDQSRKAKKAAEERNKVLDVKRKKFKDDLEAKERAFEQNFNRKTEAAEKNLQKEIERLRKEGSRLLQQEQERLRKELRQERDRLRQELHHTEHTAQDDSTDTAPETQVTRIKLKWKATKGDSQNGGYNPDVLKRILSSYGHINTLIVSSARNGSAIVEFENSGVTSDILDEKGLTDNPFTITWISGKPTRHDSASTFSTSNDHTPGDVSSPHFSNPAHQNYRIPDSSNGAGINLFTDSHKHAIVVDGPGINDRNYESLVLMRMRQAEERKRLIELMKNEDNDNA